MPDYQRVPESVGQTTMAGSLPVVLPSDQSAIPVNPVGVAVAGAIKLSPQVVIVTVAVPGTAVPLAASSTLAFSALVIANKNNIGTVCFGTSSVDKDTNRQVELVPGQDAPLGDLPGYCIDLAEHYLDGDNATDKVSVIYYA